MNKKILAAIEESLPQMQVTAIREALTELEQLREKSKNQAEAISSVREENQQLFKDLNENQQKLTTVETENTNLKIRNKELEEQANKNAVTVVEAELEGVNNTVDKFLKNTIIRETKQHHVAEKSQSVGTGYMANGQPTAVPLEHTQHRPITDETTTEQE